MVNQNEPSFDVCEPVRGFVVLTRAYLFLEPCLFRLADRATIAVRSRLPIK